MSLEITRWTALALLTVNKAISFMKVSGKTMLSAKELVTCQMATFLLGSSTPLFKMVMRFYIHPMVKSFTKETGSMAVLKGKELFIKTMVSALKAK